MTLCSMASSVDSDRRDSDLCSSPGASESACIMHAAVKGSHGVWMDVGNIDFVLYESFSLFIHYKVCRQSRLIRTGTDVPSEETCSSFLSDDALEAAAVIPSVWSVECMHACFGGTRLVTMRRGDCQAVYRRRIMPPHDVARRWDPAR